jgi:hypothetical protein
MQEIDDNNKNLEKKNVLLYQITQKKFHQKKCIAKYWNTSKINNDLCIYPFFLP